MPPLSTWLIRHGESLSNAGHPTTGNAGVGLTPKGEAQSIAAATMIVTKPDHLIVSPFLRAKIMATHIEQRWPGLHADVWPIHELTYLSPTRCLGTTYETRLAMVNDFWRRSDPHYCDGDDAESIAGFLGRLQQFHQRLNALDGSFAVVVGHGHFFSAYRFALTRGFDPSPDWMIAYRAAETANPIRNAEIITLRADQH